MRPQTPKSMFQEKVKASIWENQLLNPKDKVVIAVSGGPDSIALLHFLVEIRAEFQLGLQAVYINHGLRPQEAAAEAEFVQQTAEHWGVPVQIYSCAVREWAQKWRCSIQEAGHQIRVAVLEEIAADLGFSRIATGHHASDQVETILENFLRGSGLKGLGGITYRRDKFIHPFLGVSRPEIENYLAENGLKFCIDSSNDKDIYLRNRIRRELIPYLEEHYNPNLLNSIRRTADILQADNDLLEELTQEALGECLEPEAHPDFLAQIKVQPFLAQPRAIQRRLIRQVLQQILGSSRGLSCQNIEAVRELAQNPSSGRQVYLPGNVQARRLKKYICFEVRLVRRSIKKTNFV